jgi:glycosyltransferase involved in cell wall biosynthesis
MKPSETTLRWADLVICVKRSLFEYGDALRRMKKPVVWDAVDFWDQPEQNGLTEYEAKALLRSKIEKYDPVLVIGATQAMADAANGVYLPHHSRPGLVAGPVREQVQIVAYEGVPKYLGSWMHAIAGACMKRDWAFVINPKDLRDADIIVAFREGKYDGWMCREWKSGVKIVNAMAAGRPIITQDNAAFRELSPIGTTVTDPQELAAAFDKYADQALRQSAVSQSRSEALTLERVAARYRRILLDAHQVAA